MKVHFFNPGYEASVGLGNHHYTPTRPVQHFRHDLSTLPLYLKDEGDKVYVKNKISNPSHTHPDIVNKITHEMELTPWGWAPELIGLFGKEKVPYSEDEMRHFTSRRLSLELWDLIQAQSPNIFSSFIAPQILYSPRDINPKILEESQWVLKDEFSSSGRGVHFIHDSAQLLEFIEKRKSNNKTALFLEPFYDKVEDRGYEFYRHQSGEIKYLGPSHFLTEDGHYKCNAIQSHLELEELFRNRLTTPSHDMYINILSVALSQLNLGQYEGYLGIDTLVFRDRKGIERIVPCIEINCRPTMGHIALSLSKWLMLDFSGEFSILHLPSAGHMSSLASPHPLYTFSEKPNKPGQYLLTPMMENSKFVALIRIFEK